MVTDWLTIFQGFSFVIFAGLVFHEKLSFYQLSHLVPIFLYFYFFFRAAMPLSLDPTLMSVGVLLREGRDDNVAFDSKVFDFPHFMQTTVTGRLVHSVLIALPLSGLNIFHF